MSNRAQVGTRRDFVRMLAGGAVALVGSATAAAGIPLRSGRRAEHPDPRPDVDGSNVLTAEDLSGNPDLIPLFEGIAKIPRIADGIRCSCGCASTPGIRSLLSCYEKSSRMAMFCEICQAEGRLVVRLHERGRPLDQIRAALDARFG